MFGLFNRRPVETRAAEIDAGALFASFFQYGGGGSYSWQLSPAVLASTLSNSANNSAIVNHSRRMSNVSPLLVSYRRAMTGGILTGEPEAPEFAEAVPERVAEAAADLWTRHHDCEYERDLLHRLIIDGELLILDDGHIVPADGFEPAMTGPDWMREVIGYKIGRSASVRRLGLLYIGDRRAGESRALPWQGPALPFAAALANIRISAGHGLGALSKVAAVIANVSPDRVAAGAGARTGVVDGPNANSGDPMQPITSVGVGSIPYLRRGEQIARAMAGPDKTAQDYEALLEADCAAALNLPLHELKSDYSTGSFSNLRMAWQDAEREYGRRRLWWHRHYRLPLWRALLSDAFADGRLPRMSGATMAALKQPKWSGPRREPPQPEKEAQALALLTDKGIYTPAQALEKLES